MRMCEHMPIDRARGKVCVDAKRERGSNRYQVQPSAGAMATCLDTEAVIYHIYSIYLLLKFDLDTMDGSSRPYPTPSTLAHASPSLSLTPPRGPSSSIHATASSRVEPAPTVARHERFLHNQRTFTIGAMLHSGRALGNIGGSGDFSKVC